MRNPELANLCEKVRAHGPLPWVDFRVLAGIRVRKAFQRRARERRWPGISQYDLAA